MLKGGELSRTRDRAAHLYAMCGDIQFNYEDKS